MIAACPHCAWSDEVEDKACDADEREHGREEHPLTIGKGPVKAQAVSRWYKGTPSGFV